MEWGKIVALFLMQKTNDKKNFITFNRLDTNWFSFLRIYKAKHCFLQKLNNSDKKWE
jgi:hypothetical protein